ncbi:hypothetical protein ABPG75_006375 [Micractinium tetrahymenae]
MRGTALLLALLLAAGAGRAQVTVNTGKAAGTYDPCLDPPTGVSRGDPFVFGLAFWPGGKVSDWGATYNATSGAPGLNPCLELPVTTNTGQTAGTYQSYLNSKGVVWGTYMIKVDTLVGLRATRAEIDQIWKQVLTSMQDSPVISVIAFRGQNRSEAQYIRSNSSTETQGTGIVQQLSLMVSWDRGAFAGFTWYNGGPCDACGGPTGGTCVQTSYEPSYQKYTQSACAWSFDACTCNAGLNCPANNCTTSVYVGHRGSDKPGRSMQSGYQIEQINKYSLTSFFWKIIDGVLDVFGNSGLTGSAGAQSTAPVVLGGATEAEVAAAQAAQQQQGQPLAAGTR